MKVQETIILLHGLARTKNSMKVIEKTFIKEGFFVINADYPSTQNTIEDLAENTLPNLLQQCPENSNIHFVTHSMGGIIIRYYLKHFPVERLGKVVMLGPPNQGSEVVDKLKNIPGFYFLNGDAGLQLGTGQMSVPVSLGKVDFDLGVIAGSRSINLFLSTLISGKDDGKVSVENTKVEGMKDHITLPVTHPFMMTNKKVIQQTIHYIKHGCFLK